MLKIWGRRSSFNVQKVMWLIGELELAHEHIDAGGSAGGLDTPAFLAMNPHGRIPVIADGDAIVWESHAVLRYLAARYGAGRFWSDDPVAARRRRRLDGLVADRAAAGFSHRRVLGILPDAGRQAKLAGDQRGAVTLRHAFRQARPAAGRPLLPARRDLVARRHHGRHVALSLFRTGDRAAVTAAGRALVSARCRSARLPDPHHDFRSANCSGGWILAVG